MTTPPHVTAVVVTYNRAGLLARCLDSLRRQRRLPDTLVVVDNASSDETGAVLDRLAADHPFAHVELVRLQENTGGAGGFATGMTRALDLGTDWVWTMDDDIAPDEDCLEQLLAHTDLSECLQAQRLLADGSAQPWEPVTAVATMTTTFLDNVSFANGKDVAFTNVACFEGVLVSRRVLELVGPPDPAFFIVGDDTLFGLKASVHTNIAIVGAARMRRLRELGPLDPWKVYYFTRNTFLVRREACAYLGVEPTKVQNVVFRLNLALETWRHVRRGRAFVGPAVRGWRDGLAAGRRAPDAVSSRSVA